jgi:zinc protease
VDYVGPETVAKAKTQVQATFSEQLKGKYKRWKVEQLAPAKLARNTYTLIDKPGATDNQIMFIFPQKVKRDSPEWQVSQVTMDTLGGGLHGRLGKVLRSERGLTYHAGSNFSSTLMPYWLVWTFGGLEQTKPLLTGVPEVIEAYKKSSLSAEDLKESKARLMNSFQTGMELPKDRLMMKGWFYANGLPTDLAERFPKNLAKVDLKNLATFRQNLQSKTAAVYVMGDKAKVLPMLEAIGTNKDKVRIVPVSEIQ